MKKRFFLPSLLLGVSVRAYGFNPVAAMTAAQAVDEVMDTTDAAIDLAQETGVDEDLIREAEENVRRLERLNTGLRKSMYISEEIKSLSDFDLSRSKTIAGKLRMMSAKARQGRRLANLLAGKQQNSGLQVEAIKLNSKMLDELRSLRLMEFNQYLQSREQDLAARSAIERILNEERIANEKRWQLQQRKRATQ